jgi:type I restriction enzyme R subunit
VIGVFGPNRRLPHAKKAFAERYGEVENAAIRKVTGSVNKVGKPIRSYRNDALPKIAVTVDLPTTGIDLPKITNLVFLRRVNSRVLSGPGGLLPGVGAA